MSGRYWDKPWSLVEGCTPCSPGCDHCRSAAMTFGKYHNGPALAVTNPDHPDGPVPPFFTGHIITRPDRLHIPLRTRKPTVFSVWNDLFHEDVPDEFIIKAYAIMTWCPQHTFLVLTKRATRMAKILCDKDFSLKKSNAQFGMSKEYLQVDFGKNWGAWPLSNVYHGLTVCNQPELDAKIGDFLKVPGHRWLSIEPMLGEINIFDYLFIETEKNPYPDAEKDEIRVIDAVVLGGETGPGARPVHPDWVRKVRDDCAAAGVDFYFKQWGEWGESLNGVTKRKFEPEQLRYAHDDGTAFPIGKGYKPSKRLLCRVGSKRAGRLLDGKEYNDLPWRTK